MADEKPSLHIDSDWKRQAQEEKRRLAEQEQQTRQAAVAAPAGVVAGTSAPAAERAQAPRGTAREGRDAREGRELPPASLENLTQSIVTQVLFYLGDIAARGQEPMVNLDMAKHHIDTLGVIEEKTKGNLTPEEQRSLDAALYETRMRFISAASRYAELP